MKLSTAIRKGVARDGKQVFGDYFERNDDGAIIGCCALGAARIGMNPKEPELVSIYRAFGRANDRVVHMGCPIRRCEDRGRLANEPALRIVPHLNDDHKWKRERIADWLEGLGL